MEWRGPLWVAFLVSFFTMLYSKKFRKGREWKKLAWQRRHKRRKKIFDSLEDDLRKPLEKFIGFCRRIGKKGRPTIFTGIDTSLMDASQNPGLKRDIEDEQFIEDFHEKHPVMYWLWARSSNCGRCLSLWALWSFIFASFFGIVYWAFPKLVYIGAPLAKYDHSFPANLLVKVYFSVVTFTTLGFGDIKAATWLGTIIVGLEVVLGYFFLGGLIAILASKLARRS